MTTSLSVALFGTFDVDNYGDCLFPLIVKHHLAKRLGSLEVYPFSPTAHVPRIANYSHVYGFNELGNIFRKPPSCFIVGGGALLTTEYSFSVYPQLINRLYPTLLKTWLLPIMIADSWNCPCVLNAVGRGPFDERFVDLAVTYLRKVKLSLVRDPFTADWLSRINVASEVVPDSAVSVPNLLTREEWAANYSRVAKDFNLPEKFIAAQGSFHLGADHTNFTNAIADVAENTGLPVVLVPICHHHSDIVSLRIMHKVLKKRGVVSFMINKVLVTYETASILANSELYIGTSLHGSVTSLAFGKRAVSFGPSRKGKHLGVLSALGLEICHAYRTGEIPQRAAELSRTPDEWFRNRIELANSRVNEYFDRMSGIITAHPSSSIPDNWKQNSSTEEIVYPNQCDFQRINQLCREKRREMSRWKKWSQYMVRMNKIISGYYDYLVFRLRKQSVPSDRRA